MNLSETQRRFPLMVAELIRRSYAGGFELTFGEAFRTEEQQRLYVRSGRSRTMSSLHMRRLAVDFNLFKDGEYISDGGLYRPIGEIWESIGGRWGGRFGVDPAEYSKKTGWDANHFECME
ncbi:MAG: M15 family metallopeptidase [Deltaproteobacteria bacterium]|nr:M15 family metallopeptidase [Deltaproteobacteria bacterium]